MLLIHKARQDYCVVVVGIVTEKCFIIVLQFNSASYSGGLGKAGILRCHPDLAGKLAAAGELTHESTMEQKAAGLDSMTSEELKKLNHFNEM